MAKKRDFADAFAKEVASFNDSSVAVRRQKFEEDLEYIEHILGKENGFTYDRRLSFIVCTLLFKIGIYPPLTMNDTNSKIAFLLQHDDRLTLDANVALWDIFEREQTLLEAHKQWMAARKKVNDIYLHTVYMPLAVKYKVPFETLDHIVTLDSFCANRDGTFDVTGTDYGFGSDFGEHERKWGDSCRLIFKSRLWFGVDGNFMTRPMCMHEVETKPFSGKLVKLQTAYTGESMIFDYKYVNMEFKDLLFYHLEHEFRAFVEKSQIDKLVALEANTAYFQTWAVTAVDAAAPSVKPIPTDIQKLILYYLQEAGREIAHG